jgi:hypothetical protein
MFGVLLPNGYRVASRMFGVPGSNVWCFRVEHLMVPIKMFFTRVLD